MYHIKDDPRTKKTAETLSKAMFQCLKTTSLNAVTISDLYKKTGIARSTIYRLFDNPEDILYYVCDKFIEDASKEFEGRVFSNIQELCIASINLSIKNHELLEILIKNHRQDLLTELFAANFRNISMRVPVKEGLDEISLEYVEGLLYTTMTSLQTTWFLRGRKESPKQLFSYLQQYEEILGRTLIPNFPYYAG